MELFSHLRFPADDACLCPVDKCQSTWMFYLSLDSSISHQLLLQCSLTSNDFLFFIIVEIFFFLLQLQQTFLMIQQFVLADIFQSLSFQAFLFFKVSVEKSFVKQMGLFLYVIGCSSFLDLNIISLFCTCGSLTIISFGRFSGCVCFNVLNSFCVSIATLFLN